MSLARAIMSGDLAELPSRRDEDWRWSDIRGLLRVLPSPSPEGKVAEPGRFDGLAEQAAVIANGRGLTEIGVAERVSRTLALRFVADGPGAHAARLEVSIGAGSELILLETHEGGDAFVAEVDLSISIGRGARLQRIVLADEGEAAISVVRAQIELAPEARLDQTTVVTGARRQRMETRVNHNGGGAEATLDALYLVGGRRHADTTTAVVHAGPEGTTSQLIKGVAAGQGRGVFQGRIEVAAGADRTDARMASHALVLSPQAEVDAKPELVIFADDVACSHGATVGALDEEALFYARQRGIPEEAARALLTEAFLGEVVERIGHEGARQVVGAFVARRVAALA